MKTLWPTKEIMFNMANTKVSLKFDSTRSTLKTNMLEQIA